MIELCVILFRTVWTAKTVVRCTAVQYHQSMASHHRKWLVTGPDLGWGARAPCRPPTNRGPSTKPFLFYVSLMIDVHKTTTYCRALLIIVLVMPNWSWDPGLPPAKSGRDWRKDRHPHTTLSDPIANKVTGHLQNDWKADSLGRSRQSTAWILDRGAAIEKYRLPI